jgi:tetratricopeptide (TPR) repeat protein
MSHPRGTRAIARAALLAFVPCASAQTTPVASQTEDLQAYAAELEAARSASAAGTWRAADAAWSALLAAHAGHKHARTEVEELRLALKRARFWARTSEPRLDDHVSGKLVAHDRASGRIHLRYEPESLGDFQREDAGGDVSRRHPAHFSGPWTVEVEGDPETVTASSWLVALDGRGIGMRAGLRRQEDLIYTLHSAWAYGPEGQKELARAEPSTSKASAKRMRLSLGVGERSITLEVDGRKVLEVPREGDDFGSFAWISPRAPERLELKGRADRGWLDGVRDAAVAEAWSAFEAAWTDPPEFARWASPPEESPIELEFEALVARIGVRLDFKPEHKHLFEQFEPHLNKGWAESKSVLKQARELPEGRLPQAAIDFLVYASAIDLGRFQEALEVGPRLVPLDGQEISIGLLDSYLYERADRLEQADARLIGLLERWPDESAIHARRVDVLLLQGRPAAAREALDAARARLPSSRRLLERESQVVKATLGPPWKRVHEHAGRHFVVRSEVGEKVAREAAAVLDETVEHCQALFGALQEGTPRSTAYVFAGQRGYLEYVHGIADESLENSLGIYSAQLAQVVVWNQPDAAGLWNILRHEAVHRYLHARAGSLPRWLDEGLAESISSEFLAPGGARMGQVRPEWVAVLRAQGGSVEPLQLFAYRESDFTATIERNYALAWAWMHFLRFVDEEGRPVFASLWQAVADGSDVNAALDAAFEGRDVNAMQMRFVEFLNGLMKG